MNHAYCDYIIDQLRDWHPVTVRKMFGGYGLYRNGTIFGIVVNDGFYLKVNDSTRVDFQTAGSEPFKYKAKGKTIALSYWQVPTDILEDTVEIAKWAEKAYQANVTAKTTGRPLGHSPLR